MRLRCEWRLREWRLEETRRQTGGRGRDEEAEADRLRVTLCGVTVDNGQELVRCCSSGWAGAADPGAGQQTHHTDGSRVSFLVMDDQKGCARLSRISSVLRGG